MRLAPPSARVAGSGWCIGFVRSRIPEAKSEERLCDQGVPSVRSATARMVAVAMQFGLVTRLFAVFAAVLSEGPAWGNRTLTDRMRALRRFGHGAPPVRPTVRPLATFRKGTRLRREALCGRPRGARLHPHETRGLNSSFGRWVALTPRPHSWRPGSGISDASAWRRATRSRLSRMPERAWPGPGRYPARSISMP